MEIRTLAEVLVWLPPYIAEDFTCPDRGPHDWTSADIPHVSAQYCRYCPAKKVIPCRSTGAPERGWWTYAVGR